MPSQKVKGICTLIGALSLNLILGNHYTWACINVYYASYLHHNDTPNIKIQDAYFIMPSIILLGYIFFTIGVKIQDKFGVRFTNFLSGLFILLTFLILKYSSKFKINIIGFIFAGISNGLGYLSVIKNCWKYYPNNKGWVTGIILIGHGLCSFILNPIADFILINPNQEKTEKNGFYNKKIANNIIKYYNFVLIYFFILTIISVSLSFTYENDINDNNNNLISDIIIEEKKNDNKYLIKALKSKQNFYLSLFCFGGPFFTILLTNTNRDFGNKNKLNQKGLQIMSLLIAFLNGSTRFIWGYFVDKFKFKEILFFILIIQLIISLSIYFIAYYKFLIIYIIENLIIAILNSGIFTLLAPTFSKFFGIKYGAEIFGITGIIVGISCFGGPIIAKFIIKENTDYLILYLTSSGIILITIVFLIFFKEEKFEFGNDNFEQLKNEDE